MVRRIYLAILFIFFTSHSWGWSTEELYSRCKPYANNGFNLEQLSEKDQFAAVSCVSYFTGSKAVSFEICLNAQKLYRMSLETTDIKSKRELEVSSKLIGALGSDMVDVSVNAVIRSFINYADQNTQVWNVQPVTISYIASSWPCDVTKTY